MIHLGYTDHEKRQTIEQYCATHGIEHVVAISPEKFPFSLDGADNVTYESTIMYVTFYRLLQEIHTGTLIILSECLRTQNRYELNYNCIRMFLNQTTVRLSNSARLIASSLLSSASTSVTGR